MSLFLFNLGWEGFFYFSPYTKASSGFLGNSNSLFLFSQPTSLILKECSNDILGLSHYTFESGDAEGIRGTPLPSDVQRPQSLRGRCFKEIFEGIDPDVLCVPKLSCVSDLTGHMNNNGMLPASLHSTFSSNGSTPHLSQNTIFILKPEYNIEYNTKSVMFGSVGVCA